MSYDYCDYEQPEFYRQKIVTARKLHRCDECGCDIRRGEQYEAFAGKWDGIVSTYSTCERCLSFRTWYSANRPCFCWCFGEMLEAAQEDVRNDAHVMLNDAPGFMFEVGRRYVAIRRRADADRKTRRAAASVDAHA